MTSAGLSFRLRIKANYDEARMFTEGPENENVSTGVALDMDRIAAATMIAHEVRIGQLLGKKAIVDSARRWVNTNSPPPRMGIGRRLSPKNRLPAGDSAGG
jgi:hypothetical protein